MALNLDAIYSKDSANNVTGLVVPGGGKYLERNLTNYFTTAEVAAMRSNVWTGIDLAAIATKFENALLNAVTNGARLVVDGKLFIKLNRPVRYVGGLKLESESPSVSAFGLVLYPDLSIDWPVTYPNRGVLETANFQYPTLPPGAASWPNAKPDFSHISSLRNVAIRCNYDSLWSANKNRVPDYGFVVHCANEAWEMHGCYTYYARKAGFLISGLQSTPTFYNCGAFNTGFGIDTIFGDVVTRTTGGAFGASVSVYATQWIAHTVFCVEAASNTDLATLAASNVLSINGSSYTVQSVGAVKQINQTTRISGVATTSRYILHITVDVNIPAFTRGRVLHTGLYFGYHPVAAFAPGILASDGGQGCAGMVNTYNFSGDVNIDGLFGVEGSGTLNMAGAKSEYNGSLVVISTNSNGGSKAKAVATGGYRVDGDGVTNMVDQSVCRIIGGQGRASFYATGGFVNAGGYANLVQDLSDSGRPSVTTNVAGNGFVAYCGDSTEPSYLSSIETTRVLAVDNGATIETRSLSSASYRFRLQTNYSGTNTHRFQTGAAGAERDFIVVDGGSNPTAIKYKGWNGSAMVDMLTFNGTGGMGLFGATPVSKPTVTGAKGSNAALGSLITALATLGLVTDSSTT